MNEYQYYEFATRDRPLTCTEMAELRAISSRAIITPAGFTNHYEWGDLKADPVDWMRRYFDAFVHSASRRSCCLSLRLPKATFRKAELRPFANWWASWEKASPRNSGSVTRRCSRTMHPAARMAGCASANRTPVP